VAEIAVARSGGDDQIVVRHGLFGSFHDATVEIECNNFRHEHFNVFVRAENGADGRSDLCRGKSGGCDLIKKRLEGVEILAIDDRDLNGRIGERLRGVQAAEAGAYDYYSRFPFTTHVAMAHSLLFQCPPL